jgi:hypothetical protein
VGFDPFWAAHLSGALSPPKPHGIQERVRAARTVEHGLPIVPFTRE